MKVLISPLYPDTPMPAYQTAGSACFDLCCRSAFTLCPGDTLIVGTGLVMQIDDGFCGLVCSRSGLASRHSVFVLNAPGVIDSDYRGEVGVILHNAGRQKYHAKAGDRIAQMLIQPAVRAWLRPVTEEALSATERGAGGFGSTGT